MDRGKLTLENMCVMGDVILIESKPATHSKNPKTPVVTVPQTNVCASQSPEFINPDKAEISPFNRMNGATITAEPRLVQYASWMVELLQYGSELLIRTA